MTKVIEFPRELTADEVLENHKGVFEQVMMVGWSPDGSLVMAGTVDPCEAIALFEAGKHTFLREMFE
jgi:hypothetical protein